MKKTGLHQQMITRGFKLSLVCLLFILLAGARASAFTVKPGDDVSFIATSGSKNAIFKSNSPVIYNIDIENSLATKEDGKITYRILTEKGKFMDEDSIKISVNSKGAKHLELSMPAKPPGFYKLMMMINVDDYDDTIRRAFGVDPDRIQSAYGKPADFDEFWQNTKDSLAQVKPNFRMKEIPDSSRDNRRLYLVEMQSLDNLTIRGWLTIPISKDKNKKFSVMLGLPGYQVNLIPGYGDDPDIAIFYLNVRGQGNSRDVIHTKREDFITYHIEDKNKYVMRGVIMDCIRAIDFIYSRPELDHNKILVTGGSMGGFLAAATAGLDSRVSLYSAQNPIFSDIRNLDGEVDWPVLDIKRYVRTKPGLTYDKVMDNLDYFDTKNFASGIRSPILVGVGLLDPLTPPNCVYGFYNNIPKDKKIIIFENLGHEIGANYVIYQGRWMRDTFGLF